MPTRTKLFALIAFIAITLSACAPAAPVVVVATVEIPVEQTVVVTTEVTREVTVEVTREVKVTAVPSATESASPTPTRELAAPSEGQTPYCELIMGVWQKRSGPESFVQKLLEGAKNANNLNHGKVKNWEPAGCQ